MRILILGASGRVGRLVLEEALTKGHTVTALVRSESSISSQPGITTVIGSPLVTADLDKAFAATPQDPIQAVVVTLRLNTTSYSPFAPLSPGTNPNLGAETAQNLFKAMPRHSVRRLVYLNAHGTGSSFTQLNLLVRGLFSHSPMKYGLADHNAVDELVRTAAKKGVVDFVLLRPVMLADGEAAAVKDWGDDGKGTGMLSKITKKSVARFIVEACEVDTYVGRSPVISN